MNWGKYPLKKQHPYFRGDFIVVACGSKGKKFALVVEDCGDKWSSGAAKWDYVRVRKYHASKNTFTATTIQVARESIFGKCERENLPPKLKAWIEAAVRNEELNSNGSK